MPAKKPTPNKQNEAYWKGKGINKGNKRKKKRKPRRKSTFTYTLLPKRKRLTKKVLLKLMNENYYFALSRGVDVINKLQHEKQEGYYSTTNKDEKVWRLSQKRNAEYQKLKEKKVANIKNRAAARRKKIEAKRRHELRRKIYRLHPNDTAYRYIDGYTKSRHRITKRRFMKCVDVSLFQEVLKGNTELLGSPLWNEKLYVRSFSAEKSKQIKHHLHQFDVLVESLKQGLFDMPNCDSFPIDKVRRKKKKGIDTKNVQPKTKSPPSSISSGKIVRHRMSFPPYKKSAQEIGEDLSKLEVLKGAINKVAKWIGRSTIYKDSTATLNLKMIKPTEGDQPAAVSSVVRRTVDGKLKDESELEPEVSHSFKWGQKTSLKVFPPLLRHKSRDRTSTAHGAGHRELTPYADFLTINVPKEPFQRKKFICSLIERKTKKKGKTATKMAKNEKVKQEEEELRQRRERLEKTNPLQRLHRDEKDSDIWTATSSTTTDGYASWRRPRDLRNAGNKQAILAHKVDTTFGWRVILLLIVIWEIGCFVKAKLDDIYYWIFSSHLYKENIWLFEPTLFSPPEKYAVLHVQEWAHFFISGISLSIIHRENECVSLLFAFSLMIDGATEVAISTHDYMYLPDPISWICVALTTLHILWKVWIVCLFIGYHYYCSGYIRKSREFRHRKTRLHNHEINVKGTKGIQKRRMAWSWMTGHARNSNLRRLKQKYPNARNCNFPLGSEELRREVKFSETKELRLYTQKHDLNIGYPYNKLRDIQRHVFKRLEKSDYSDKDEAKNKHEFQKKLSKMVRKSSRAITVEKWQDWKQRQSSKHRLVQLNEMDGKAPVQASRSFMKTNNPTLGSSFSHHAF